ncbi:MAG: peptidoglycan editing factor PgeF [Deltaproteobacteria bacterium]|nr:peptidoglycan editing factor PgeF [Deltaproteobacteria bacterium]
MKTTQLWTFPLPPHWLHAEGWDRFPALVHGFSTHIENRDQLSIDLNACGWDFRTLKQVHGDEILFVTAGSTKDVTEADGFITQAEGVLLGIATADCVPVLLVAPQQRVVAALHAGWRGTLKGITARALELLSSSWHVEPTEVWLACGPAIGPCCYEVSRDVGESLYERWGAGTPATWQPKGEKGMLDLRLLNLLQGEQSGVPRNQMQMVGPCTFCDVSRFASYRRQGAQAARQFSVIGWQQVMNNSR